MLLNINATRAFIHCFFTILNQKEFRIATVAMFTCDLYAGVVSQMSPPPHDLQRLRTTMVDLIVIMFNQQQKASSISSEPDQHLTHILTPSCFFFLHIPHNLAITTIIPVIIFILVRDRIFQNAAVAVFGHNDRCLHSIYSCRLPQQSIFRS